LPILARLLDTRSDRLNIEPVVPLDGSDYVCKKYGQKSIICCFGRISTVQSSNPKTAELQERIEADQAD